MAVAYNYFSSNGFNTTRQSSHLRNTGFALIQCGNRLNYDAQTAKVFRSVYEEVGHFDEPLFDPLQFFTQQLLVGGNEEEKRRKRGTLQHLNSDFKRGALRFLRDDVTKRFVTNMANP